MPVHPYDAESYELYLLAHIAAGVAANGDVGGPPEIALHARRVLEELKADCADRKAAEQQRLNRRFDERKRVARILDACAHPDLNALYLQHLKYEDDTRRAGEQMSNSKSKKKRDEGHKLWLVAQEHRDTAFKALEAARSKLRVKLYQEGDCDPAGD